MTQVHLRQNYADLTPKSLGYVDIHLVQASYQTLGLKSKTPHFANILTLGLSENLLLHALNRLPIINSFK